MFDLSIVCFSIKAIRGSRSGIGCTKRTGPNDEEICGIIVAEVAVEIKEAIPELFGLVKTMFIEEYDGCYATVTQDSIIVAIAAIAAARL